MNADLVAEVNDFAELARGFCSWIEGPSLGEEQEIAITVWLAKLHAAAIVLPEVESANADEWPDIPVSALEAVQHNLSCFSGMYYREFFDPNPTLSDESCMGDVGDDLIDIYQDIRRGLFLFERQQPLEALWYWSFLHRIHWGRHAVGAMFALHCLAGSITDESEP